MMLVLFKFGTSVFIKKPLFVALFDLCKEEENGTCYLIYSLKLRSKLISDKYDVQGVVEWVPRKAVDIRYKRLLSGPEKVLND